MRQLIVLVTAFTSTMAFSQLTVTQVDENTAADIITGPGVIWTNVNHSGGADQLGAFEIEDTNPLGFPDINGADGIVLVTGTLDNINTYNAYQGVTGMPASSGSSAALVTEFPGPPVIIDMTEIQLNFIASASEVEFQFVFASDEYPEYINALYQDVMGIYIQGTNYSGPFAGYQNISYLPGTTTPVSIPTVNENVNSQYYVNNHFGTGNLPIEFDGLTVPLTITLDNLVCGDEYKMIFAVGNVNDEHLESAIFIAANSIKTNFVVDDLTIVGPQPYCEGEDIAAFVNSSPDWTYEWDDGQSGLGLGSITTPAIFGDNSISVTVTDPDGCQQVRTGTIEVHTNNNQPPSLSSGPDKLYVQMGESICGEFYSTDAANEDVTMTLDLANIFPNPTVLNIAPDFNGADLTGANPDHDSKKWCFEFFNFNDYGEYNIPIILTDNNACHSESTTHNLTIDVLCPSCPEILYVDYRNPSHYPFIEDAVIDAASEIYVGTLDQQPGHEVDCEDYNIEFVAQEIAIEGFNCTNCEVYTSPGSCSSLCLECCKPNNPITFDLPPDFPITTITPFTSPGVDDVFYISDLNNQFNAYNATRYRFKVWPASDLNWYPPSQIIWQLSSEGLLDFPFDHCNTFETPTEQHPYETFWWEGTFQGYGSAFFGVFLFEYYPGQPVPPGLYFYTVDLYACKDDDLLGNQGIGHHTLIPGFIYVSSSSMAPVNPEDIEDRLENIEDFNFSEEFMTDGEGLESEFDEIGIRIFPNPTNDYINIALFGLETGVSEVIIFDLSGNSVMTQQITGNQGKISLKALARGIYYIQVKNGQYETMEKIVLH